MGAGKLARLTPQVAKVEIFGSRLIVKRVNRGEESFRSAERSAAIKIIRRNLWLARRLVSIFLCAYWNASQQHHHGDQ